MIYISRYKSRYYTSMHRACDKFKAHRKGFSNEDIYPRYGISSKYEKMQLFAKVESTIQMTLKACKEVQRL